MSLRIAFDVDGVLADMLGAFQRELPVAGSMFGRVAAAPIAGGEPAERWTATLTERDRRKLWRKARSRSNFWESLEEIEPGSVRRLHQLSVDRRWEVLFITTRPSTAGDPAQRQTQRWLARHGFELPSVYVVGGSRGKVADALQLDIVVDDRAENCLDVKAESKARAILVWPGPKKTASARPERTHVADRALQLGIGVVQSVRECLDILESVDDGSRPSPRGRVLRQLADRLGLTGTERGSRLAERLGSRSDSDSGQSVED